MRHELTRDVLNFSGHKNVGKYRSAEGESLQCDPGSELRRGGEIETQKSKNMAKKKLDGIIIKEKARTILCCIQYATDVKNLLFLA